MIDLRRQKSHNDYTERMLQTQVKSLRDLCSSQEKMIQKCVKTLQKKSETIAKYKQQAKTLKEEKNNLTLIAARDETMLEASRSIFEQDEEDIVRLMQSPSESPAPFYRNSVGESLSLLDELGGDFQDFAGAKAFTFDQAAGPPAHLKVPQRLPTPMQFVSPIIRPDIGVLHDDNLIELNPFTSTLQSPTYKPDDNLEEIRELVESTHTLLKEFLAPKPSPTRRRKPVRIGVLGRLTESKLFKLNL